MNKRTLIFLLLFTLSIFLIQNFWFGQKNGKPQTEQLQQTPTETAVKPAIPIQSLPLAELYKDSEGKEFFSKTLAFGNGFLVEASQSTLPQELYVKFPAEAFPSQKVNLDAALKKHSPLVFYSASSPQLNSMYLPQNVMSDLQFVILGSETDIPEITVGEYENDQVYFPDGNPSKNAIALYQMQGTLIPVGYYNAEKKSFTPLTDISSLTSFTAFKKLPKTDFANNEEYYVLENAYQQLVFSTIGGSIAEINLPFSSPENKESVVRPISFDKMIEESHTSNARFPEQPAWMIESGKAVFKKPEIGGYTPLIRRGLLGKDGKTTFSEAPRYHALSVLSDDKETQRGRYTVRRFEKDLIEFELKTGSRRIVKTYSFPKSDQDAPYVVNLSMKIDGDTRNLWLSSGVPEVELISGSFTPSLKYRITRNAKPTVEKVSLPKNETNVGSIHPDWVSNSNGFFGLILDPLTEIAPGFKADFVPGNFDPTRLTLIDQENNLYPADKYPGYQFNLPLPRSNQPMQFRMFAGPYATEILKRVDAAYTDPNTGSNPDYLASQSFQGWFSFISEPFAKFLFLLMKGFYSLTHSWGFSIILLTLALRIMLYPLNAWSIKSTLRMQAVQPLVQKIQEKYKKDPKKAQLEQMQLYREKKANPFTGCLPLLIQMPFLIGMFDLLKSTFELRGVSFIPGWITNLTAPDVLFSWHYPIPFFGTNFHLLPIILGVIMFVQQKFMSMTSKTKGPLTDQQKQQQKMGSFMTIIFTVMFYHFPSGLNLYWISSMGLSIVQQWYMSKRFKQPSTTLEIIK